MNETLEIIKSVLSEYGKCGEQIALAEIVEEPKGSEQTSDVPGVETEHVEQFGDEAGGVPYYGNIYVSLAVSERHSEIYSALQKRVIDAENAHVESLQSVDMLFNLLKEVFLWSMPSKDKDPEEIARRAFRSLFYDKIEAALADADSLASRFISRT